MASVRDNLPPNLRVIADALPSEGGPPAIGALRRELDQIASQLGPRQGVAEVPPPAPEEVALGLVHSFASTGALAMSVSSGSDRLEPCPVPGCGRRRTRR